MDKALLLKSRLAEDEVEVPGVGTVRVRGLSRLDVLELQRADRETPGLFERKMLALGMVDPELTEDEAEQWQRGSHKDEMEPVLDKISELSALNKGADTEAYKEFESDPDAEFRVPAGGEAGDDGDPAAGGDA
jgi:hypothetical protein